MVVSRCLTVGLFAVLAACSSSVEERPVPQHQIVNPVDLLDPSGRLVEPGWSPRQLIRWDATRVHDPKRLRQWDFFTIMTEAAAVNLTITDLGFAQSCSVSLIDFATGKKTETSVLKGFPRDEMTLSPALEGRASFTKQGAPGPAMVFDTTADGSRVSFDLASSPLGDAAHGAFSVHRRPAMPYLSLATPFAEDPTLFFFEQKLAGMTAEGSITIGDHTVELTGAIAVMDWGRGAWPSEVTWRWASAAGMVDGAMLSFNLGEGFGDPKAATENLVVHGDVAHKLAAVTWTHDADDPMRDWTFQAPDGRASLVLHPIAIETGGLDLGTKFSRLHKAYGRYAGTVVLDDGRTVRVDGMLGFAEEMQLAW